MEKLQLIIECTLDGIREEYIGSIFNIKYRLPMINSYVIEIPESEIDQLKGIRGVKAVHESAHIMAQMNFARKTVNAESAERDELTGRGVTIAVLDTGVSPVDDLTKPVDRLVVFKDFINGRTKAYDDNAHGTHVWYLK